MPPDALRPRATVAMSAEQTLAMNAAEPLFRHAEVRPGAVALRTREQSWTFGQLAWGVERMRGRLRDHAIRPGDRVLLVAPTGPGLVLAYLAVLADGAVAVTVSPQCTRHELAHFIADAGAGLCLAGDDDTEEARAAAESSGISFEPLGTGVLELLEAPGAVGGVTAPVPRPGDAPAAILYTSGTTGRPKGAVLTHANLVAASSIFVDLLGIDETDRLGTALPLFHVFGQVAVLLTGLRAGAPVSLLHPFSGPGLLAMAAEHGLTMLSGVPTMWTEMLRSETADAAASLTSLRLACSGGAALPLQVQREFRRRFGAHVLDGYGLSETSSAAAFNHPGRVVKAGSVGQALPGLELAILGEDGRRLPPGEAGEIAVRGPVVMSGYWGRPAETSEVMRGEFLRTGDVGRLDGEGYLWVLDRKKDLIIRGGYNVYPREIEEHLYAHPAVLEAAVVGVPDERLGEEVAAVLVLREDGSATPAGLRSWLAERLADYKQPRLYLLVDALPRSSTGKLLKRAIDRDLVAREAQRASRPA